MPIGLKIAVSSMTKELRFMALASAGGIVFGLLHLVWRTA